jgi:hypothetical protein
MPYTLTNVVTRAQAALGDQSGDFWVLANLLPHINTAYRAVDRAYRTHAIPFARGRTVITPFTAGSVKLDRTTTPPCPADFLEPDELWEKNVGDPDTGYVLMGRATNQLPDIVQSSSLNMWDWFQGSIYFVGATTDRTIRLDYQRGVVDLVSGSDSLVIDDALDPVALMGAGWAALSAGQSALGGSLVQQGNAVLDDLITTEVHVMQRTPRRRRAPNVAPMFTAP